MPAYRLIGKHIYRTTTQDIQMGTRMDGSPNIVRQPGLMQRVEVGTILEDVTPAELAAAPDRFEQVDEAALQAYYDNPTSLAINAPLRGCHEPVNALDAPIQKPPLTAPEVAGALAAKAEVGKVDQAHAEQYQQMHKERDEAQAKAMTETVEAELKKQQSQAREAQASRGSRSAPPAPSALPVSTSGEHSPSVPPPSSPSETPPASSAPSESSHPGEVPPPRRRP
jgi:hypothetical protein